MRKTKNELNELKKKHGVKELWSWSKYHTYKTSHYEFFLKYIKHIPENRTDGAYVAYGSAVHEVLEKFYLKEITFEQMQSDFSDRLCMLDMADLKFSRGDDIEKNEKIKTKYVENLKYFIKHHEILNCNVAIEQFLDIKVGNNVFQGYADLIRKDSEGNYIIQDWKSSSLYVGEKVSKEKGQLVLYAEGLVQKGVPIDKIKCCWNFLKYVNVETEQANGKKTTRQIERSQLGDKLCTNAKMWLKKSEYSETEIENFINDLLMYNDISVLPSEVQQKYSISDCYVFIPLEQKDIDDLKSDIISTIDEIHSKTSEYETNSNERLFWDCDVAEQSFYYATLCGYSADLMKPYKEYLEEQERKEKNKNNVFADVGSNSDDLEWLNEL